MSGGAEANRSGLTWEAWVKTLAESQDFSIRKHALRDSCTIPVQERRIVWTHVPYKTIFHNLKKSHQSVDGVRRRVWQRPGADRMQVAGCFRVSR